MSPAEKYMIPSEVDELKDDLIWTRYFYNQYKKLFTANKLRVQLLNEVAPTFFRMVQQLLVDQMIVGVSRLTDRYKQGSNKNLSIGILPDLAQKHNWEFFKELQILVDNAITVAKPIRKWRMKVVAHRDLRTALSEEFKLDIVTLEQIDDALSAIGKAINFVYLKINDSTWSWDLFSSRDADELIHHLKLATIYRDRIISEDDWLMENNDWMKSKYKDA